MRRRVTQTLKKLQSLLYAVALVICVLSYGGVAQANSGKIEISQGDQSLIYGQSRVLTLWLDAPIVVPISDPDTVTVNFTSSDPARLSITPSSVVWDSPSWSQSRTITIQESPTVTYGSGENVTFSESVVTSSIYYGNAANSYTIALQDTLPPTPVLVNQQVPILNNGQSTTVNALTGATGDPDASTLSIVTQPSHGTAVDPPGTITYTPSPGYAGSDSLVFQVCSTLDAAVCSQGTLSFLVTLPSVPGPINPLTPDTGFVGQAWQVPLAPMLAFLGAVLLLIGIAITRTRRSGLIR